VIGAVLEVSNTLGAGFLQRVYERALLTEPGLRHSVGEYVADILVEDVLVIELNCVERLANEHTAQVSDPATALSGLRVHRAATAT
jgi:hypothetical protein